MISRARRMETTGTAAHPLNVWLGGVLRTRPGGVWMVRECAPVYSALGERRAENDAAAEVDHLTSLGEAIMTLAEHIHTETHRLLQMIAEFDRREGWKLYGFSSCADWLAYS